MLHFFVGPSGCGKTTIMYDLRSRYGWRMVPTYTTRAHRENDDKVNVSPEEFQRMAIAEQFFSVKKLFGEMYGESRAAMAEAISGRTNDRWCLDLAVSELPKYDGIKALKIILLPESIEQLVNQLSDSGRTDRLDEAKNDLEKYIQLAEEVHNIAGYFILVNRYTRQGETTAAVRKSSSAYFQPEMEA